MTVPHSRIISAGRGILKQGASWHDACRRPGDGLLACGYRPVRGLLEAHDRRASTFSPPKI